MGVGQDLLASIQDELAVLPANERRKLLERATPPESWLLWVAEWHAYPSVDEDHVADSLAEIMKATKKPVASQPTEATCDPDFDKG